MSRVRPHHQGAHARQAGEQGLAQGRHQPAVRCPSGQRARARRGLGVHVGSEAIRRFLGDWFESLEEYEVQVHEMLDLGNGVVYAEVLQVARRTGSRDHLRVRSAPVYQWAGGRIARLTLYPDLGEGRRAAERAARQAPDRASP